MDRNSFACSVVSLVVSLGAIACSSNSSPSESGDQNEGGDRGAGTGGELGGGGKGTISKGTAGGGHGGEAGSPGRGGAAGADTRGAGGGSSSGGAKNAGGSVSKGGAGGAGGSTNRGGAGSHSGGQLSVDAGAGVDAGGTSAGGKDGGGSAEGGAGGGSGAYNPCPTNGDPCKILPLGDSITHGLNSTDDAGYRSKLFELVVAANQKITFTGTLSNGPSAVAGQTFPKSHEGHDGWTVEPGYSQYDTNKENGISLLVSKEKAFKTTPDIVLLHIGTNDLTSSSAKSTTSDRLDALLTKITGLAPNALVVVAKVIPLGYTSSDWDTYNSKIPGIVQAHAAKGEHAIAVDMSKLPSNQLNGVHPTDQGYGTMASSWYEAIKVYLPK